MHRIAVLDLGTNTFHLMIVELKGLGYTILVKEKVAVKIGMDGISEGKITESAQIRALDAMRGFQTKIEAFNVNHVFGTATSAIRNAANGQKLVDRIKTETAIEIRIISGNEEAELIYKGIKSSIELGQDHSVIMDIGGGSVEFIICNQQEIFWKESFEIGAQRLLDGFHKNDPITKEETLLLNTFLKNALQNLADAVSQYQPKILIGASGSFDTIAEIYALSRGEKYNGVSSELEFPMADFEKIYKEILHSNRGERMAIPGMIEMRVDMIVVACTLIDYVLSIVNPVRLRVANASLKEGLLVRAMEEMQL